MTGLPQTVVRDAPATTQGVVPLKRPRRIIWKIVLGVVLSLVGLVAGVFVLCFCLWSYLFVSLMPRPWMQRNAPVPALHAATAAVDIQGMTRCLEAGDPVDLQAFGAAQWGDGTTPLMIAASQGDAAATELLLDHGADLGKTDYSGSSAIHFASHATLEILLQRGANINARTRFGQTPLTCAAVHARRTKDLRVIRLLLEKGADVNARDTQGRTVIGVLRTWPDPDPVVIRMIEEAGGQ